MIEIKIHCADQTGSAIVVASSGPELVISLMGKAKRGCR